MVTDNNIANISKMSLF